jgi:inosine/xanthosine triphosphate pyrophosphatase family protein
VTNAELTGEAKDAISHRGKAVRAIVGVLAETWSEAERFRGVK